MTNLDIIQFFLGLVAQPTIDRNREADFIPIGIRDINMPLPINGSNTGRKINNRTFHHG